jgi:hypothetical protein
VDIFALDELLQAGKNLVPGCENDCKRALSTGFVKQIRLHGGLPILRARPLFRRPPKMLSFLRGADPPRNPSFDETAQKIVRAIAHSNTSSHGTRTTIVLATISFGSVLAASLVR